MAKDMKSVINVLPAYNEGEEVQLRARLQQMGDSLKFEDDTWFCNKLKKSPGHTNKKYVIYFSQIPEQYRDIVKYYVLRDNIQITTLSTRVGRMVNFFKFLVREYNAIPLEKVDKGITDAYQLYLSSCDYTKSTKQNDWLAIYRLFEVMSDWPGMPVSVPLNAKNPWKRTFKDRRIDSKYIPEFVTKQLDEIFINKAIPIHLRLAYWLMRAIPSRSSEITGMSIDCLKAYGDNYVLSIPTWKQNGANFDAQIRCIHIEYKEFGKYLVDLIQEQQAVARKLQECCKDKGMLFTIERWRLDRYHYQRTGELYYIKENIEPYVFNTTGMANIFKTMCKRFEVKDESGNSYSITSHQLRHNGITDRLHDGFSLIEVRDMTGHQGTGMLFNAYYHVDHKINKEKQENLIEAKYGASEAAPVYFRGRILNMDDQTEKRLLRNPRAYQISDGNKRLGICSDITTCQSNMFECLDCDYLVLDADSLPYYEEQVEIWTKKVQLFKSQKYAKEKAEYMLSLYQKAVYRIKREVEAINSC